ncbi:SDR family NAD(P)-dependent oxidoreductase [Rubrivivax sp. JA1026]|uniref:SDR family NAD(P)-dependent oxidoreductase n=1 Tax=Rubrivivax sp. JA1026 TaxID=2710888 RepID=UPI0013E93920|nr:SDR family oxidoreductase [Rubrivivax sp. JA1026]
MNTLAPPRTALVTGGSRGLGRDAVLHLARAGWDLVFTFHSRAAEAEAVAAQVRALGRRAVALQFDAGAVASIPAFVEALRGALADGIGRPALDAVVHNAGFGVHAAFAETTQADFDALMNVHLKGPFFLTQALLPLLADGARILHVSSGLTRFSLPGYAAYATMKGAVEVLTRYLAKELGARGIRVNTLAPGAIETDFGGGAVRDDTRLNAYVAAQTALGRVGRPEDIGGAVAALLADESGWVTGQRIEASGGMFI